jgi:hypothetical protein
MGRARARTHDARAGARARTPHLARGGGRREAACARPPCSAGEPRPKNLEVALRVCVPSPDGKGVGPPEQADRVRRLLLSLRAAGDGHRGGQARPGRRQAGLPACECRAAGTDVDRDADTQRADPVPRGERRGRKQGRRGHLPRTAGSWTSPERKPALAWGLAVLAWPPVRTQSLQLLSWVTGHAAPLPIFPYKWGN